LHQCIRPLVGALLSARAISLADRPQPSHLGHQCSHTPGRPILHRRLKSSRRPRQARKWLRHQYLSFSLNSSFVRAGRRSFCTCFLRFLGRHVPRGGDGPLTWRSIPEPTPIRREQPRSFRASEHLGRTRAPVNWPQSTARGETAPRAPVQKLPGIAVWLDVYSLGDQPAL
jgi:hypothetical protein